MSTLISSYLFICVEIRKSAGLRTRMDFCNSKRLSKGKSVPLQARRCPEGSRNLRFPDYVTMTQNGGKVVSLTHRPFLPQENIPGTYFG